MTADSPSEAALKEQNPGALTRLSDMSFLEWKRSCDRKGFRCKALQHIIMPPITTSETKQTLRRIMEMTDQTSWSTLPLWDQRKTFGPTSYDYFFLCAAVELKEIIWMLLADRTRLDAKMVHSISVFKDLAGTTDEFDPHARGPSLYLEIGPPR